MDRQQVAQAQLKETGLRARTRLSSLLVLGVVALLPNLAAARFVPQLASFSTIDISAKINHDWKYYGAVLAGNGRVYFVPYYADNVGELDLDSGSTVVEKGMVPKTSGCDNGGSGWRLYNCRTAEWAGTLDLGPGELDIMFHSDESGKRNPSDTMTIFVHGVEALVMVNTGCYPDVCSYKLEWPGPGALKIVQTSSKDEGHYHAQISRISHLEPGYSPGKEPVFSTIDISSKINHDHKYVGGALARNGRVYFAPCNADNIGQLDPSTGAFSTMDISGKINHDRKYCGGVLAGNGRVYLVPYNADNVGELDPSTGAFSTIDISGTISHDLKYREGVLAGNGRVYFVPWNADNIGQLDPSTGVFSTMDISAKISHDAKYVGGVLAGNGRVYFVPRNADNIGVLDPSTDAFSTIDISGKISHNDKYYGGVLAGNGRVYLVPRNADNIGVLDPSTDAFSTIDISAKINHDKKYTGGVLAGNGRVYFVPVDADNIGELDPSAGAFSTIDISNKINHDWKYHGGVLAGNGRIYLVPNSADNIGELTVVCAPGQYKSAPLSRAGTNTISGYSALMAYTHFAGYCRAGVTDVKLQAVSELSPQPVCL